MFVTWLHEQGYRFTGDASFYRLTVAELRGLYRGYDVTERVRRDAEMGVSQEDRANLREFDEKLASGEFDADGYGSSRRESDE